MPDADAEAGLKRGRVVVVVVVVVLSGRKLLGLELHAVHMLLP